MTVDEALRILGIKSSKPTEKEIKAAYRVKAFLLAPDRLPPNASEDMVNRATEALKEVNEAYSYVISNIKIFAKPEQPQERNQNTHHEGKNYPAPILVITPNPTRFNEIGHLETRTTHIKVTNIGGPCTNFLMATSELPKWLEITEIKRLPNQALPVQIHIKATGQQLGEKYECAIPIKTINKDSGYKDEAIIHIEMVMKGPTLQIDRNHVEFNIIPGIIPPPQTVTLRNSGVGYIEGTLTPAEQWIKISPRTVWFNNKQDIQIQIDTARLNRDYSSYVDIRTRCGDAIITVRAIFHNPQTRTTSMADKNNVIAPFTLYYCPKCKKNTIWYNRHQNRYECLKCKRHWKKPDDFK